MKKRPQKGAILEAKKCPNGYVYEIDDCFSYNDAIPPEAIRGAWKVDENGNIIGEFIPNPNYKDLKEKLG